MTLGHPTRRRCHRPKPMVTMSLIMAAFLLAALLIILATSLRPEIPDTTTEAHQVIPEGGTLNDIFEGLQNGTLKVPDPVLDTGEPNPDYIEFVTQVNSAVANPHASTKAVTERIDDAIRELDIDIPD